jgi:VCBS repeat-containing protein
MPYKPDRTSTQSASLQIPVFLAAMSPVLLSLLAGARQFRTIAQAAVTAVALCLAVTAAAADSHIMLDFVRGGEGGHQGFSMDPVTGKFYQRPGFGRMGGSPPYVFVFENAEHFAAGGPRTIVNLQFPGFAGTYFVVRNGKLYGRTDSMDNSWPSTSSISRWNAVTGQLELTSSIPNMGGINGTHTFPWGGFSGVNWLQDSTGMYVFGDSLSGPWMICKMAEDLSVIETRIVNNTDLGFAFPINGHLFVGQSSFAPFINSKLKIISGIFSGLSSQFIGSSPWYIDNLFYDSKADVLYLHNYAVSGLYKVSGASTKFGVANYAPGANDDSYQLNEDSSIIVDAPGVMSNDLDPDHNPITTELVSSTSHGSLILQQDGSFTYTPTPNFHGIDTFSYRVTDGTLYSAETTVTITVHPVNDAPIVANSIPDQIGDYGTSFSLTVPGATFFDVDGDALTLSAGGLPGGVVFDADTGAFSGVITEAGNFVVSVTATDLSEGSITDTFTISIEKVKLTVVADDVLRIYGDANPVFTGTLTGVVNGDDITASYTSTANGASSVGVYSIIPVLNDADGRLANYTIDPNNGTLTITARLLNVAAHAQRKVYGVSDPALTLSSDTLVPGDSFTGGLVRTAGESVGLYAISQGTLSAGANYSIVFTGENMEITPASLVVTADNASRAYGEINPAFTGSLTGVVGSDNITATYSSAAMPLSSVASYDIEPALLDPNGKLGNYAVTMNNGTLTIHPAVANVAANAQGKTYGQTNPTLDALVTGEVSGGDALAYTLETTATQFSGVGGYPITVTLGANPNYTVTSADSTLTVHPAPLEVTIHSPASGYLAPVNTAIDFSGSYTLTGVEGPYQAYWTFDSATSFEHSEWATIAGTSVGDQFTFEAPGVYTTHLTVVDPTQPEGIAVTADTVENDLPAYVVVYDPTGGFVTGGGWIHSPAGAFHPDLAEFAGVTGKASFGFVAKYLKGANVPTGNTEFQFKAGGLNFKSSTYEWLVVAGARAQYKGWGTINGEDNYGFMLTAIDGQVNGGGGVDRFRIKIWDATVNVVVYDNQVASGDNDALADHTIIGGGSIVIHQAPGPKK